jgi:pyridoxamine 5'-phosphate oxidase
MCVGNFVNAYVLIRLNNMDTSNLRQDYTHGSLQENSIANNPFSQFEIWFNQAMDNNLAEPYAMSLATVDSNMQPHIRTVLMRNFDTSGLCFFTNYSSAKGMHISHSQKVSVLFFWQALERQVRINGVLSKLSYAQNQEYFNKRPFGSKIAASISPQSKTISSREFLECEYTKLENEYKYKPEQLQCPEFWGGYKLTPNYFEFWQGRASRLHDRLVYELNHFNDNDNGENVWSLYRIAP